MYNEKLLRAAIMHEAFSGRAETTEIICRTLHKMGLQKYSDFFTSSNAMSFAESDSTKPEQIITVLNALGYEIETQN